jgi:hypothetical protein
MSEQATAPAASASIPTPATAELTKTAEAASAPVEANEDNSKDDAQLSKAEKKEQANIKKKFQLKVDGEVEDFEIDLANEEEVKKQLQLARAAQKRMKESTELRKAVEEFIEETKKNPRNIMKQLGINEKELAQMIMNEELAELEKSPEQKEIERLQKQLEEIQNTKKKEEEDRKKSDFERMKQEAEQRIETDISSALESGGLAKTPYTVKKMAEIMYIALENDIDLKPNDVIPILRRQMESDFKEFFAATNDDQLEEFLKDQLPRIRKRSVAKAKEASVVKNVKEPAMSPGKPEEIKKMTISDFLKGKK